MSKFDQVSEDILKAVITPDKTLVEICKELNLCDNTYNRDKLKTYCSEHNLQYKEIHKISKKDYDKNPFYCKECGKKIEWKKDIGRNHDFCNHSCAASYNNRGHCKNRPPLPEHSYCLNCGKEITRGHKYCDKKCQDQYEFNQYIQQWQEGKESGITGNQGISHRIRKYLFNKYNNSCQICGWDQVNPNTGLVPLHIHHIDGDCHNNKEENLQLLCPNCHSLTDNYGAKNKNCTRIDQRRR